MLRVNRVRRLAGGGRPSVTSPDTADVADTLLGTAGDGDAPT